MKYRALSLCLATLALALFATAVRAEDKTGTRGKSCTGTVVSVDATGEKLVVKENGTGTSTGGNNPGAATNSEKTFSLTNATKLSCDGKMCQLGDLKAGMKVRIWTKPTDPTAVMKVEALDKDADFGHGGGR